MMVRPPYGDDVNNAPATDSAAVQIPVVDRPAGTVGMPYGSVQGPYQVQVVPVPVPAAPSKASDIQLILGLAAAFYFLMRG
jgi:hypothetical protein